MEMTQRQRSLLVYIAQCLAGTAIGYYLYTLYPTIGAWCLISIILVLAPDRKDAMTLAKTRIKANLVGAAIGLIIFFIHPVNLLIVCVGITLSIVACELLKLQPATRSAAIAVLIITMHESGKHFWDIALERAGGVLAGCIIGMLITWAFHTVIIRSKKAIRKIVK